MFWSAERVVSSNESSNEGQDLVVESVVRQCTEVRPADVNLSEWDCTLEGGALRLGLHMLKGLSAAYGAQVVQRRPFGGYKTVQALARSSRLPRHELARLALAGALRNLHADSPVYERGALVSAGAHTPIRTEPIQLNRCAALSRGELLQLIESFGDFGEGELFFGMSLDQSTRYSIEWSDALRVALDEAPSNELLPAHPLALMRRSLKSAGATRADELGKCKNGAQVAVGGLVICRERPSTRKAMAFLSIEDESGVADVVIPARIFESRRAMLFGALCLVVEGTVERTHGAATIRCLSAKPIHFQSLVR